MLALADLTGRILAHAVWCVSDPETFIPLIAHEKEGKRGMFRLGSPSLEECVEDGKRWLDKNPDGVERAMLVFDGYLTVAGQPKRDALFLRAVEYGERPILLEIALPYVPGGTAQGFKVGSPKVIKSEGIPEDGWETFFGRFWVGAKGHDEAAKVWARHLDDAL